VVGTMKLILLGSIALIALAGVDRALAANMPVKAPPPVYPWTGWYVGVNAGYESSGANVDTGSANTYAFPFSGGPNLASAITALSNFNVPTNNNSFIGGGQIGSSWQLARIWVTGIEADIQGTAGDKRSASVGSTVAVPAFPANSVDQTASLNDKAAFRQSNSGPQIT
jgi:outer membrane immunogenic protein